MGKTLDGVVPMNFKFRRPPSKGERSTGRYCYIVQFIDGREAFFIVETVEHDNGTLILRGRREEVCAAFAPGSWLCIYAASAATGDPMALDWIDDGEKQK